MIRPKFEAIVLTFALLIVALALIGCTATTPPGPTQESVAQPESDEPIQVTILAEDIPAGLDYDGPTAALPTTQTGIVNLLEPLLYYAKGEVNSEGIQLLNFNEFEGRLAESWEFDEETLSWTFHLRQGVVGCDGATFNADDVLYTLARAKSVSGSAPASWFMASVMSIDGFTAAVFQGETELGDEVTKIDDYTISVRQSGPNQLFPSIFAVFPTYIYDKETMEANATEADPWSHDYGNNENAPSFGPYCLESWVKGEEFVVVANPDYYRGKAAIDRIVYRRVPESANRVAAVQSGAAQLVEHLTPKEYDSLLSAENVAVAGVFGNENLFIHMNFKSPPFDNLLVRQAVASAIPYEDIISAAYFDQGRKWEGLICPCYPGFHTPSASYTYDPDRARELLAEAGYPGGEGLEQFAENLNLYYVSEKESTLGPIATILQTALRDIGMPVELSPIPQAQYGDRQLVKKDLPFALNDHESSISADVIYATLLFFVSTEAGALNNMANYNNPEIDMLFNQAVNEVDPEAREQIAIEIQETIMADLVWVPVVARKTQWAFANNLTGITWHPDNSLRWYDLSLAD